MSEPAALAVLGTVVAIVWVLWSSAYSVHKESPSDESLKFLNTLGPILSLCVLLCTVFSYWFLPVELTIALGGFAALMTIASVGMSGKAISARMRTVARWFAVAAVFTATGWMIGRESSDGQAPRAAVVAIDDAVSINDVIAMEELLDTAMRERRMYKRRAVKCESDAHFTPPPFPAPPLGHAERQRDLGPWCAKSIQEFDRRRHVGVGRDCIDPSADWL